MVFGLIGQRSRSQGHKVQKLIEGNRVAGASLHLSLFLPEQHKDDSSKSDV